MLCRTSRSANPLNLSGVNETPNLDMALMMSSIAAFVRWCFDTATKNAASPADAARSNSTASLRRDRAAIFSLGRLSSKPPPAAPAGGGDGSGGGGRGGSAAP